MMTKKYISLNSTRLVTTVMVNGIEAVIEFKGGKKKPEMTYGSFVTDNELIQNALESSNSYGKTYILKPEVEQQVNTTQTKLTEIPTIKTKQMAIEWLEAEKSVKLSRNRGITTIEQIANTFGYTFPNLK